MLVLRLDRQVRRRSLLAAAFFGALLLVRGALELTGPAAPVGSEAAEPLRQVAGAEDAVVLTFNVTWGSRVPERVLERLDALDASATFFVSGPWARGHPELVRRMAAAGHDVASLGDTAANLTALDPARVREEIARSLRGVAAAAGAEPTFFRPPGGAYDREVLAAAEALGLRTVLWNVDARDWLAPGAAVIASRVSAQAQAGSVVLLHASDGNEQTLRAIDRIVQELRRRDLRTVPLSRLLPPRRSRGPRPTAEPARPRVAAAAAARPLRAARA